MKEKYLLAIKNAMFWHFGSSEIKETIGDIDVYFVSALQDGASEQEVTERYGDPKLFVREMRNQPDLMERKRKRAIFLKIALLAIAMLGMIVSFGTYSSVLSACLFVIFSSVFVWFLAGNSCVIEIITLTEKKKKFFWKSQIAIGLFFLFLQFGVVVIVPYVAKNNIIAPLDLLGVCLRIVIYSCLFLLGIATVIFIRKMLQGNIYMFFCTIQNITMMYGLILYYDYLKHMENLEEIGFIFTPYLLCIPVMLAYWAYVKKIKRGMVIHNGCTN